tara:strand:+ start:6343 stop:9333 length:2991 start_codon:yes stop_codon:yes gene_type:complete
MIIRMPLSAIFIIANTLALSACGGGSADNDEAIAEGVDVPVVFVKRKDEALGNPTDGIRFSAGGDLYLLQRATPASKAKNLTGHLTQNEGDVSDPEPSFDGKRVVFSMRRPGDESWNIWEYNIDTDSLTPLLIDEDGDDVDPAYLPDGRIIFSSNRQQREKQLQQAQNIEPYAHLDEYEREPVISLHVFDPEASEPKTTIRQISFNQSHDRNPVVLSNGKVMFSRWDHLGQKNHFPIFTTNPDGTGLFVHYGAFSPGNSFLHPRETERGTIISSLMPLSGTYEAGAIVEIDIENFFDNEDPDPDSLQAGLINDEQQGQQQVTLFDIPLGREESDKGRFTTPFPLTDGTPRALVSWTPYRPKEEENPLSGEVMEVEGTPAFGIYMLNLDDKSMDLIVPPETGYQMLDAIPLQQRPTPNITADKINADSLAVDDALPTGILNVFSVYDTDGLGRMGDAALAPHESIPKTAPTGTDTRDEIADLARLKDPAITPPQQRPARFARISRAVPTPRGISRETIGETMMEMQQILGYTEIQPDGSVMVEVPADTPLQITALDSEGRAFQIHSSWLQVRPGETRTCNGCHSPRRGDSINGPGLRQLHANVIPSMQALVSETNPDGETMAVTRQRVIGDIQLQADIIFRDVWSDSQQVNSATPPTSIIDYSGLTTPSPQRGYINYPEHVQPIWETPRGNDGSLTCTNCHNSDIQDSIGPNGSQGLNLSSTIDGTGRLTSYQELMIGDPLLDENGLPLISVNDEGEINLERQSPLVSPGMARASHLVEKLSEQELKAGEELIAVDERLLDHSTLLNPSEKRIIYEWIDLGAQYYNDPYIDGAADDGFFAIDELRGAPPQLSEETFAENVHPVLMSRCAGCHQPFGGNGTVVLPGEATVNSQFDGHRYVLTGQIDGDFNATLSMVDDVDNPEQSYLLLRPRSVLEDPVPHPQRNLHRNPETGEPIIDPDTGQAVIPEPILDPSDSDYLTILDWVTSSRTENSAPEQQ